MGSKIIEKKILPEYFNKVKEGTKKFELQKDEDNAQIGDILVLKEWDGEKFTGEARIKIISYVLRDVQHYGLVEGYCIIGWK